jgi:uncharacterized LabA/DUF88 family protein
LALGLLKPGQKLVKIKYFTSLITSNVDKRLRQKEYIKALSTIESVQIIYGVFQRETIHCGLCGQDSTENSEKMTDVNIATHLLEDYYNDACDMAMLISGDTDLIPPIRLINENHGTKRVFVAFPPSRVNEHVRRYSKGDMVIGRKKLADSQFSNKIVIDKEEIATRPASWV